jgi:septal ring factor EnvC (AmiA/AmiB activator)
LPNFTTLFFLLAFSLSIPCSIAQAEVSPPIPAKKSEMNAINKKIENEKRNKSDIKIKLNKIEAELKSTKIDLLKISNSIKSKEKKLKKLENRSKELELEKNNIKTRLEKEHGSVADLILALQRIRRVPPEALFLKPGSPLKTAQTVMLLQSTLPHIKMELETLTADLEKINFIDQTLNNEKETIEIAIAALDKEYSALNKIVDKRKDLFKKTQKDFELKDAKIKKLAKEARSVQELMNNINKEKINKSNERTARLTSPKNFTPLIPMPKRGVKQLPISGSIKVKFGDKDHLGAKSRGLTIEGRPGSLVVAPMGGIVRFAGFFKHHGNIVIIEHENGYHSLVAELDKIDTLVGQSLVSGEPIGRIQGSINKPPIIYYELRFKGQPINPNKKFSDLI